MHRITTIFLSFCLLLPIACGPEIVVLFIPAISATWCEENVPCHKFSLWPDTTTQQFRHQGVLTGREFFINPNDGQKYKDPDFRDLGENSVIGTFEHLNVEFILHKRTSVIEERAYAGGMEVENGEVNRMVLESLTSGRPLVLIREPVACACP